MQRTRNNIWTFFSILMMGMSFMDCSDDIAEPRTQTMRSYTLTVKAENRNSGALTRALTEESTTEGATKLKATWQNGEKVYVKKETNATWASGSLEAQEIGAIAKLSGTIFLPENESLVAGEEITLQFPKSGDISYADQEGTLKGIATNFDYSTARAKIETVSASGNIGISETLSFTNHQAIVKFSLTDNADDPKALNPTSLFISNNEGNIATLTDITPETYGTNGDGVLYVALPDVSNDTITLTANVDGRIYTYTTPTADTFEKGKYYFVSVKMKEALPLTLEAATADAIVNVNFNGITLATPIYYRINQGEWTEIATTEGTTVSIPLENAGDKVQFWSNNATLGGYIYNNLYHYRQEVYVSITTDKDCYAYGNIMSLIDDKDGATADNPKFFCDKVIGAEYALTHLFSSGYDDGNKILTHTTKKLELPAETLTGYCYESLFAGCKGITEAPILPATTLAEYCYYGMFSTTGLTEAPALPATTMAKNCYSAMFTYCTNLSNTPSLPATTLAEYCYEYMFDGCTSLTEAPTLPATELTLNCYASMFAHCTNLTKAPVLRATTLATSCCNFMFRDCTNLTEAPDLLATTLAKYCYSGMFLGCTSLIKSPSLPATTLAEFCYERMFYGCTSLTCAPILPATTLVEGCYFTMFFNCSKLNSVTCLASDFSGVDCVAGWLNGVSENGTFTKASDVDESFWVGRIPSGWTIK